MFDHLRMREDVQKVEEVLQRIPRALRLVWRASSKWTGGWILVLALQGLLPAASVYLTKWVLDAAQIAVGNGLEWENVSILLIPASLMAAVMLATRTLSSMASWIQTAQSELVQDHIQSRIHAKATGVDMKYYESPEYYDLLDQATGNASSKPLELLSSLGSAFQNGITVVSIAALLIPYGWWVPLALLLSTAPALFVVVHYKRQHHNWWERTTPDRRRASYYNLLVTNEWSAAEMRVFGLGDVFQRGYQTLRSELRNERISLQRRQALATLLASLGALLLMGAVMGWMLWRALAGTATLGDLGLFYQSFSRGQGLMRDLLKSVGTIYSNSFFLEQLFRFLELEPDLTAPADPEPFPTLLTEGIRFENVTFRYPGTDRAALRNFDVSIPAGATVALVGPNGVGKSTIIKLLCRFYDPDEGRVTIDGTDLRHFDPEKLRQNISILFQTPVRYQAPAAENIAYGDIRRPVEKETVDAAARRALADRFLKPLPNGYDTHLGKWFSGGTELSGGQWQRVCLARAFYRNAPIIVLDEPTSAMDSWAENEWLQQFGELVHDRTGLVVTHRFTTAMHADIIYVMRDNAIIESGTHDELLEQDGYYALSWRNQVESGWRTADEREDVPSPPGIVGRS